MTLAAINLLHLSLVYKGISVNETSFILKKKKKKKKNLPRGRNVNNNNIETTERNKTDYFLYGGLMGSEYHANELDYNKDILLHRTVREGKKNHKKCRSTEVSNDSSET